ncbi:MAG: hypothetical protein FD161_2077 [Limisphaerales bacterium]|nr:MAG: hypothetical protein FD161_2077 [Limisphaerales bacterium]KAG0508982.1 MAG: hypothetical protein E1N63_1879 [Limisphaerales bacterium]TXT51297.1 MAG: hypothetical protein FD140_1756 [Limisphaerales bacterium]
MTSDTSTPDPRPQTPDLGAADAWLTPGRFALILAALLAATFWRVLFGDEAFFYRDYGFLGYPFAHFHRECFWSGDFFPLWNPYVNCGAPFLAQWNTLCLYPGALIYLLLPLPWSLGFFCVAHLFLGGMGMRALAERWTGSRFGAAVAGVAFVFSGLVLGCVIYPNYLVALGWMPWVMLAVRRSWQEGGRSVVLAALAGAMQMLTGAPEIILLTWALLTALAVMDAAVKRKTENVSRGFLTNYALRITSTIALITGLCAAQLLPFFQLLSLSQRSGDAVNTFWSLPGWGWVNLFFPLFMNFQTEQGVFVMIGQSFFPSVYLGIVPLTLALLAAWRVRTPEVKLLGATTLLAVLLAMGDNFVLWRWLREVLPLGVVRFPVKALLLAAFTVPLLAAWGMSVLVPIAERLRAEANPRTDGAMDSLDKFYDRVRALLAAAKFDHPIGLILWLGIVVSVQRWLWPFSVGTRTPGSATGLTSWMVALLVLNVALLSPLPRRRTMATLLFLAIIATAGWRKNPALLATIPASAFEPGLATAYHASKGALTPAPKLGESRIMLSPQAELALHTRMVPKFYDDFIGQRLAFWGNLNLLDGLPKVNGASTLVTREWNDVEYFLYGTTNPAPANLMDFLGVTHTTKPGELMQWERRETAMPLVSLPAAVVEETSPSHGFKKTSEPDWNPRQLSFIATPTTPESYEMKFDFSRPEAPFLTGAVRVSRFSPMNIEVLAEANAAHGIVIAQNFYPSWRATVNGQTAPVLRANHTFQAIPIPAGKSTVRLDYVDWPFRIGAGISALTLLGCVVLWRRGSS